MRAYIVRRLFLVIPTLFLLSLLTFFLVAVIPGDIVDSIRGEAGIEALEIDRETLERELGIDAPIIVRYARWLGIIPQRDGGFSGVLQGTLGSSWWGGGLVLELLSGALPISLQLGLMTVLVSQLIALPIGTYSGLRQDTWGDYVGRSLGILGISVPYFWVGTLIITLPAIWWGYMPSISVIRFVDDPIGNLVLFLVPAAVLGMALAGLTMRMTRTMMLEVARQDYVRTAWAKGLSERVVVIRHCLRNAVIPVITIIGLQMTTVIGGVVIIEEIFSLPGAGRLLVAALLNRDQPLITGIVLLFGGILIVVNLLVDLTYGFFDPRVRYT